MNALRKMLYCVTVFGMAVSVLAWSLKAQGNQETGKRLHILFIGNSYTARHNLAQVVKAMAEAGQPGLTVDVSSVIYGGRRLVDHWRLGTANFVNLHRLTEAEGQATIAELEKMVEKDPDDRYAKAAIRRHRQLLKSLDSQRQTWDVVVLQSYRDDLKGDASLYVEYAPKFAELAREQGARVILYETTPKTQNARPLSGKPDPSPILEKARTIKRLAENTDASVVPMSLAALRCQTERPDLALRFVNDAHLNQTMAYLTACAFYAALFNRSPEGLPVNSITDIRFLDNRDRDKDRDGGPITRTFSRKDCADMQRIAWQAYRQFQSLEVQ